MWVEAESRGGVRVVTLRRPPVNALNLELAEAVHDRIAEAAADATCAAVVLTGLPGVFSAGIDTREVPAYDADRRGAMLRRINRTILALYGLPKPAVAAVSGHALGGALVLALACDLRIAARGPFRLGLTEVEAGIPFPAGPLAVVQAELAPEALRRLALTSATGDAESPALAGVFDRVVAAEALVGEAVREAERLAGLRSYARVKAQLRAATLERLRGIVERDLEPLLDRWV